MQTEKKFDRLEPIKAGTHVSPETALVQENYPYGFRLRCKIRYWLEFKKSNGYRLCSQTTNPKKPSEVWNKPKCSTYVDLALMGIKRGGEEDGHVAWVTHRAYSQKELALFVAKYGAFFGEQETNIAKAMEATLENQKRPWILRYCLAYFIPWMSSMTLENCKQTGIAATSMDDWKERMDEDAALCETLMVEWAKLTPEQIMAFKNSPDKELKDWLIVTMWPNSKLAKSKEVISAFPNPDQT